MDFSRQKDIFNPKEFDTPIHIIGAGATGSWVALFLAKMGVNDITVYDFDIVEEHNISNQAYSVKDISYHKVDALHDMIVNTADVEIKTIDKAVDKDFEFDGIVIMLTDTMFSRKSIFEGSIRYNSKIKLFIETRMGLESGRIYAINPAEMSHVKKYEKTLYSDDEASASACGISQSIVATATNIASRVVWKIIKYHNGIEMDNEVLIDLQNNNEICSKF